jgi:hypothetical protein
MLGNVIGKSEEWEPESSSNNFYFQVATPAPPKVKQKSSEYHAWVLAEDLLKLNLGAGIDHPGCLIGSKRKKMYKEVLALCHERIYVESKQYLAERPPTKDILEAKFLCGNALVFHKTQAGEFSGGAVAREFAVRAQPANSDADKENVDTIAVCYIDMCASVNMARAHAGVDIFDTITSMGFDCVVCHTPHKQSTVNFWESRGMRRFRVDSGEDCLNFKKQILEHTGKICELVDVQAAIPRSALPLLVFVSVRWAGLRVAPREGRQLIVGVAAKPRAPCMLDSWLNYNQNFGDPATYMDR